MLLALILWGSPSNSGCGPGVGEACLDNRLTFPAGPDGGARQGLVLGGFVQGIAVRGNVFIGGPFDWLSPYAILTAVGLVAGYALLGATWLILETEDDLHGHARRWAAFAAGLTAGLLATVSLATPLRTGAHRRALRGLGTMPDLARLLPLLPIPGSWGSPVSWW